MSPVMLWWPPGHTGWTNNDMFYFQAECNHSNQNQIEHDKAIPGNYYNFTEITFLRISTGYFFQVFTFLRNENKTSICWRVL